MEIDNPHDAFMAIGLEASVLASAPFSPGEVERRYALLGRLKLDGAIDDAELSAQGAPADTWHALRIMLGSAAELEGDLSKLSRPASLATEERVWAVMRGYCKEARAFLSGGQSGSSLKEAKREKEPRKKLAILYKAAKKGLLADLDGRIATLALRSKKSGRVVGQLVTGK